MESSAKSTGRKRRSQKAVRYLRLTEGDSRGYIISAKSSARSLLATAAATLVGIPATLKESFSFVHEFPKEIWAVFVLKFLESYSYFAVSQILVLYLHTEFGVSDITAGAIYGLWGAIITLTGILTSWINDSLGVRRATLCGFFLSFVSFLILALTLSLDAVYVVIFFLLPLGESMGIPMLTVAIRRCTTQKNRGFAFGLYYSVMNVAALLSGPVVDGFNIGLPNGVVIGTRNLSGNRFVVLTCAFATFCSFLVSLFVLKDVKVVETDDTEGTTTPSPLHVVRVDGGREDVTFEIESGIESKKVASVMTTQAPHALSPCETCTSLCTSATFWRYAALTLLLVNLHAVFRHLDATLPTYLVRLYGNGVPKGMIYSINPMMIIFLTPLVAALTSKYNHFNMIKWGGYITGISPFFLVASTSIWAVCMMVIFISLGEAIWSPRVYDYVMSIAPEGKEASFSALASAPLFAAKIPVGLMSGYLLATYLPEDESERRQPKMLWLYIGLLTISSPILITLFDPCIREPEAPKISNAMQSSDDSVDAQSMTRSSGDNENSYGAGVDVDAAGPGLQLRKDRSGSEGFDETRSLLRKASRSKNFPELSRSEREKKLKFSRSTSISSNEAEELCAVTLQNEDSDEANIRHGSSDCFPDYFPEGDDEEVIFSTL